LNPNQWPTFNKHDEQRKLLQKHASRKESELLVMNSVAKGKLADACMIASFLLNTKNMPKFNDTQRGSPTNNIADNLKKMLR